MYHTVAKNGELVYVPPGWIISLASVKHSEPVSGFAMSVLPMHGVEDSLVTTRDGSDDLAKDVKDSIDAILNVFAAAQLLEGTS